MDLSKDQISAFLDELEKRNSTQVWEYGTVVGTDTTGTTTKAIVTINNATVPIKVPLAKSCYVSAGDVLAMTRRNRKQASSRVGVFAMGPPTTSSSTDGIVYADNYASIQAACDDAHAKWPNGAKIQLAGRFYGSLPATNGPNADACVRGYEGQWLAGAGENITSLQTNATSGKIIDLSNADYAKVTDLRVRGTFNTAAAQPTVPLWGIYAGRAQQVLVDHCEATQVHVGFFSGPKSSSYTRIRDSNLINNLFSVVISGNFVEVRDCRITAGYAGVMLHNMVELNSGETPYINSDNLIHHCYFEKTNNVDFTGVWDNGAHTIISDCRMDVVGNNSINYNLIPALPWVPQGRPSSAATQSIRRGNWLGSVSERTDRDTTQYQWNGVQTITPGGFTRVWHHYGTPKYKLFITPHGTTPYSFNTVTDTDYFDVYTASGAPANAAFEWFIDA